jgi:hypothetical protein
VAYACSYSIQGLGKRIKDMDAFVSQNQEARYGLLKYHNAPIAAWLVGDITCLKPAATGEGAGRL